MGKTKVPVSHENRRSSPRLASRAKATLVEKRKPAKKAPKAKKAAKAAENGNPKTEEPKTEAAEAN